MARPVDLFPAPVPASARTTQAGDARGRWPWAEPAVWTDRMLTALEQGVKGGRWFSLIGKVYARTTLERAFARVKANDGGPGIDHVTIGQFESHPDANLDRPHRTLWDGTYRPQAVRRTWVPKPGSRGKRPPGISTVRDRVVQTALRMVLEPICELDFAPHSYGFRPRRGAKDALRRVDALIKDGFTWVVDAGIRSYFDAIPREPLMARAREKVSDGRVPGLIEAYLEQPVMDAPASWTPEAGTPQGAVISPLLSNIYLDPLDHLMAQSGFEMVRYADDFVILCSSQAQAREALELVAAWMADAGLTLHPDKTCIVDATGTGGFDFLGYHFGPDSRRPRKKSLRKLKDTIRAKTRRNNGKSLHAIIASVNPTLRGWFEYFKHSHRFIFERLDGWIRMRLRSILRKRRGGRGRARGRDHQRRPNAFFAEQGLFSLKAAFASARQSPRG